MRRALVDQGIEGVALMITGRVLSQDCKTPLGEVLMDVWQADAAGRYDNDGTFGRGATPLRLRGRLVTDASGAYSIRTILPGRYLNGSTYRPAHVHVKLSARGHQPITTQLYFPDDPYNAGDPFIRKSLIMQTQTKPDGVQAHYEFVLPAA
jgi:catechol 1,2-dioxygenase